MLRARIREKDFSLKPVILRTYLGKSHHPKICKNCPFEMNEINGAVFENFWMMRFSQVLPLKNRL